MRLPGWCDAPGLTQQPLPQATDLAFELVPITGVVEPSTGLQSKFSTVHSAAVALIDGAAGVPQYSDAKAADSLVAALTKWKHPTSQVLVSRVVHDGDKMQVSGKVENLTAASKTYNLKFQFIDVNGKVLGSQDVPPLTVDPHGSQPFDVSATEPGVIAYKYLPVD